MPFRHCMQFHLQNTVFKCGLLSTQWAVELGAGKGKIRNSIVQNKG